MIKYVFFLIFWLVMGCSVLEAGTNAPKDHWSYFSDIYFIDQYGNRKQGKSVLYQSGRFPNQRVTIMGAVRYPGVYLSDGRIDIAVLLNLAQPVKAPLARGQLEVINVIRSIGDRCKILILDFYNIPEVDGKGSFYLKDGDILIVPYRVLW